MEFLKLKKLCVTIEEKLVLETDGTFAVVKSGSATDSGEIETLKYVQNSAVK